MLLSIYSIILNWFLFEKCGEQGWKSLIPFYNTFTFFKVAKAKGWGIASIIAQAFLIVSLIVYYITIFGSMIAVAAAESSGSEAGTAAALASIFTMSLGTLFLVFVAIAVGAFRMVGAYKLGKQFNLDTGFLVGMVLLPIVFESIVAFSAEYKYGGLENSNTAATY